MKKLFLIIMIQNFVWLNSFAQSADDLTQQFAKLKKDAIEATSAKQVKEASMNLDAFLSHVYIERSNSERHNEVPFFCCRYDHTPLTISAILRDGANSDTIQFQNGRWYITKNLSDDMEIDLLCFENSIDSKNKQFQKTLGTMRKKYAYQLGDELAGKNASVFFVKEENLYYAAIESKKIPAFNILSNSGIINYASCLKAILKASNVETTYDEIIGQYLNTTIDEQFVPTKNNSGMIAGRKVVTTFVPQTSLDAATIVNELAKERFVIAIDQNGNIGLLTAIAITGATDYQPVHVRMRMPMLGKEEQRIQMSWQDFNSRMIALVKVDVY